MIWQSILSSITGFLSAISKYIGVAFAYMLGRKRAESEVLKDAKEARDEQVEIASRKPIDRDELLKRMRNKGF